MQKITMLVDQLDACDDDEQQTQVIIVDSYEEAQSPRLDAKPYNDADGFTVIPNDLPALVEEEEEDMIHEYAAA